MKNKYFYSSLVETSELYLDLGEMQLSPDERVHLISLIDANIHSEVVITILSNLPEEEKKVFLKNLISENHEETWKHLKINALEIEEKIKASISRVKKDLQKDIKKIKKIK